MNSKLVVVGTLLVLSLALVPSASANSIVFDNAGVGLAVVGCLTGPCGTDYCGGIFNTIGCAATYGTTSADLLLYGES